MLVVGLRVLVGVATVFGAMLVLPAYSVVVVAMRVGSLVPGAVAFAAFVHVVVAFIVVAKVKSFGDCSGGKQ